MTDSVARPERHWHLALLVIGGAAAVRLLFAALLPPFPDEAYYWDWSRRLATGYFDHPPAVAWSIAPGVALFGATAFGVRFGPVILGFVASYAAIGTACLVGGPTAALTAAVVLTVLPLAAAGLVLATPDAPLLATVAVTIYAVIRAIYAPVGSRDSLAWWIVAGVALGFSFWSKYTAVLVPVGVLAAFALRAELRPRFREPGPYVACAIATLVFLPVLLWNARHDWISFTFQLAHGFAPVARPFWSGLARYQGDFIGGQLGLVTPVLFVMMIAATVPALRRSASPERFTLAMIVVAIFAVVTYSAVRKHVEANWPAPAYVAAVILLATHPWQRTGRRWLIGGVAFAGALTMIVYVHAVHPILPIPAPRDPVARAFGWQDVAAETQRLALELQRETGTPAWVGGNRYQEASLLAFHGEGHPFVFATNMGRRGNHYDIWPGFSQVAQPGDHLVLALPERNPPELDRLRDHFRDARDGPTITLRRAGDSVAVARTLLLVGWTGGWPR